MLNVENLGRQFNLYTSRQLLSLLVQSFGYAIREPSSLMCENHQKSITEKRFLRLLIDHELIFGALFFLSIVKVHFINSSDESSFFPYNPQCLCLKTKRFLTHFKAKNF